MNYLIHEYIIYKVIKSITLTSYYVLLFKYSFCQMKIFELKKVLQLFEAKSC